MASEVPGEIHAPKIAAMMDEEDEDSLEEIKSCFSLFDKKGDMKVESKRIVDVLRSLGLNPLTEDVDCCLENSKLVGQRVDFETFYSIFVQVSEKPAVGSYNDIVEGLRTLDRDQTGTISTAELRQYLLKVADKMTEEEVVQVLGPHEGSGGTLAYEALIRTVMSG